MGPIGPATSSRLSPGPIRSIITCRSSAPVTWRRRRGHHIRHRLGSNVLEDPALRSFRSGRRPAGNRYAAGGGGHDTGATGGRQIHPASSSGAGGVICRRGHHSLRSYLRSGRVDLHQVPHLRQNSDGAEQPLVDRWLVRIQGTYRDDGPRPAAGLLVFLAAASIRATCQRAQVGHAVRGIGRLVRLRRRSCRQRLSWGRIMTHALDVNERISELDRSATIAKPASARSTTPASKYGTFAIAFGIAFAILYTV